MFDIWTLADEDVVRQGRKIPPLRGRSDSIEMEVCVARNGGFCIFAAVQVAHRISISVDAPRLYPDLFGADRELKDDKSRAELTKLYELLGADLTE